MSTERDELANIYVDTLNAGHGVVDRPEQGLRAADAILAAGYRKPRTITTREEVDALGSGAILEDAFGDVAQLRGGLWCSHETAPMTSARMAKYLPAIVHYSPDAS